MLAAADHSFDRFSDATIAFRDQPTSAIAFATTEKTGQTEKTVSGMRPVVLRSEQPTVIARRAPSASSVTPAAVAPTFEKRRPLESIVLCVASLLFGIVAGHVVREGVAFGHSKVAAHVVPRTVVDARVELVTLTVTRAPVIKEERASSPKKRAVRKPKPTSAPVVDGIFEDFEPTFRVTP
jgi:hypothetical protein